MAASASVQNNWRTMLARIFSRDLAGVWDTHKEIVLFKIGEGGGSGGSPITPDETFIDVQGEGTPLPGGGTVEMTNGSVVVTGLGTSFLADVSPGDWIKPGPNPAGASPYAPGVPGSEEDGWGEVQTVNSNVSITLAAAYVGSTHLLAEARACHSAAEPLFVFRKALAPADVVFFSASPAIAEVTTLVAGAEANLDQLGNSPDFYEIGGFDEDGVMVFYCTFDVQTKVVGVQLVTIVQLVF